MLVRAKEMVFHDGSRRRPGSVFEYELGPGEVLPQYLTEVSEAEKEAGVSAPASPEPEPHRVQSGTKKEFKGRPSEQSVI